jgi:hypothetical protein
MFLGLYTAPISGGVFFRITVLRVVSASYLSCKLILL